MRPMLLVLALLAVGSTCLAHAQDGHQGHEAAGAAPGYGDTERAAGLREGRGMGLALPAEANGYPGPRHVLELSDRLEITADQRRQTQRLFDAMERNAQRQGQLLLEREQALDDLFRNRTANPARLVAAVEAIAQAETALKLIHLRTHLAMMEILSPAQVELYAMLRRAGAGTGLIRPRPTAAQDSEHRH